jgi:diguanylate cyclase (GGDEF)-like protein/PAS domain S-box-containing protein
MEKRYIRKDGSVVWVNLTASLVRDPSGKPRYWIAMVDNITERRRATEALRVSEERFRLAAASASDLIFEADLETGDLELVGDGEAQLAPQTLEELYATVHPEDRDYLAGLLETHKETRLPFRAEFRLLVPDGPERSVSVHGSPLEANGARKCIGAVTDITERRRAEEALAHLAAVVQASDDAILTMDLDGIITAWNHGAEQLHGYTAAEAIGRRFPFIVSEESRGSSDRLIAEVASGHSVKNYATFGRRKDGRRVPLLLTLSPVRDNRGTVVAVSAVGHDISLLKEAEDRLTHHANHDVLTGLPNRRLFEDRLQRAIDLADRRRGMAALMFVDLDGFKLINDTLGHVVGDSVLRMVADRLSGSLRKSDTLARTGGDEFCLVLGDIPSPEAATALAEGLLEALSHPFVVNGRELFVSASIGISLYPVHGGDPGVLQKTADAAMYEAKRTGKNRVFVFAPQLAELALERLEIENHLRRALSRGELSLHYQPQFRVSDLSLCGFEALLRWKHPVRGSISPAVFIPIAEETGLIVPIGNWVLRQACKTAREWEVQGVPGKLSVNASAVQFGLPDFVETVLDAIAQESVDPRRLIIEITESAVMSSFSEAAAKMERLRAIGVGISLDDFGTGYSSLSYLQKMPIDALKLDKSFLHDVGESRSAVALIKGVISLAHSLNLRVVAEGIESDEQLNAVRDMGCDEAQGFLLGMAEPFWQDARLPLL